jgi:hypothetical protein
VCRSVTIVSPRVDRPTIVPVLVSVTDDGRPRLSRYARALSRVLASPTPAP